MFLRFLFFICSVVMNITCLFRTWPYSYMATQHMNIRCTFPISVSWVWYNFIPTVLLNLHLQQVPNTYPLVARRQWLRVNCVENRNLTSSENLTLATARKHTLNSGILVAYPPSQPR